MSVGFAYQLFGRPGRQVGGVIDAAMEITFWFGENADSRESGGAGLSAS